MRGIHPLQVDHSPRRQHIAATETETPNITLRSPTPFNTNDQKKTSENLRLK